MDTVSLIEFHSAEAKALLAQFRLMETLIGNQHHPPTDGAHCENLLRDYLSQHLPENSAVATGFITCGHCTHDEQEENTLDVSPQIDILVYDKGLFAPIFNSGNTVIIHPVAVQAIIEVKKTLRSNDVKDAVEHLSDAFCASKERNGNSDEKIFRGIIAYDAEPNDCRQLLKNGLEACGDYYLPNVISILSQGTLVINKATKGIAQWYANDSNTNYALSAFMYYLKEIAFQYLNIASCEYILPKSTEINLTYPVVLQNDKSH